ncbi:hypothetical protein JCM8547_002380 [Rhodosporidiobolus lusitaniae]
MRATTLLLAAYAAAFARAGSVIAGLAGTIDNTIEAASLQSAAKVLQAGSYSIKNVATGQALTYEADGNHIIPADGVGTPVNILSYGNGVAWSRLQIGEKDKCLSSQWGGSYNLAGVMYACAVDAGGDVTRAGNTLEPTKQWFLLVPVADYQGDSAASNHVLLAAQSESVKTREKAQKNAAFASFHKKNSRSLAVDMSTNRFALVPRARKARVPFKHWGGSSKAFKDTQKKKKASSSKSKSSSSSSSQKKKAAAAQKAAAAARKKAKVKSSSKKTASNKSSQKAGAKKVASTNSLSSIKLNAAVSNRYFIIPVDHLIDMHTLALTGHQIESFRAQSTALDLWDASDKYQQWTITRVR